MEPLGSFGAEESKDQTITVRVAFQYWLATPPYLNPDGPYSKPQVLNVSLPAARMAESENTIYLFNVRSLIQAIIDDISDQNIKDQISQQTPLKYFDGRAWKKISGPTLEIDPAKVYTQNVSDLDYYRAEGYEPPFIIDIMVMNSAMMSLQQIASQMLQQQASQLNFRLNPIHTQLNNRPPTLQAVAEEEDSNSQVGGSELRSTRNVFVASDIPDPLNLGMGFNLENSSVIQTREDPVSTAPQLSLSQLILKKRLERDLQQHYEFNNVDFAFVYADPLLIREQLTDKIIEEAGGISNVVLKIKETKDHPLQLMKEYHRIKDMIKKSKKGFRMMKKLGTAENLLSVQGKQPLILHISSHGVPLGNDQYSLLFESSSETCHVKHFKESDIKQMLKKTDAQKTLIVFLSACHSEKLGKMFKKYGVPIVIAINKNVTVLDDAAFKFAEGLYDGLLNGKTPEEAFNQGVTQVNLAQTNNSFSRCCCEHEHELSCEWNARNRLAREDTSREEHTARCKEIAFHSHQYHLCIKEKDGIPLVLPECSCRQGAARFKGGILHNRTCLYLAGFVKKFLPWVTDIRKIPDKWKQTNTLYRACCCRPELPHDEMTKFLLVKRDEPTPQMADPKDSADEVQKKKVRYEKALAKYAQMEEYDTVVWKTPLFTKNRRGGSFEEIERQETKEFFSKRYVPPDSIIMRKERVKRVVDFILKKGAFDTVHSDITILIVHGQKGLSKGDIVNYAVQTSLHYDIPYKWVAFFDAQSKQESIESLKEALAGFLKLSERTLMEHCARLQVENSTALLVLHKIDNLIIGWPNQFMSFISDINNQIKVIIVSDIESLETQELSRKTSWLKVSEFTPIEAIQFLAKKNVFYTKGFLKFCEKETKEEASKKLGEHALLSDKPPVSFQLSPLGLNQLLEQLKTKTVDEILDERVGLATITNDAGIVGYKVNLLLQDFKMDSNLLHYQLLCILCYLPLGIQIEQFPQIARMLEKGGLSFDQKLFQKFLDRLSQTDDQVQSSQNYNFLDQTYEGTNMVQVKTEEIAQAIIQRLGQEAALKTQMRDLFVKSLAYAASQARNILNWYHQSSLVAQIDLGIITAAPNEGPDWRSYLSQSEHFRHLISPARKGLQSHSSQMDLKITASAISEFVPGQNSQDSPENSFNQLLDTFLKFSSLDFLKQGCQNEFSSEVFHLLEELAICTISLPVEQYRPTQSKKLFTEWTQLAQKLKLTGLSRKIALLKTSKLVRFLQIIVIIVAPTQGQEPNYYLAQETSENIAEALE